MNKKHIFLEARKLVDTLNRFGNCLVPSIHEDKSDTTAIERLAWLMDKAKNDGLTVDDVEDGIMALNNER